MQTKKLTVNKKAINGAYELIFFIKDFLDSKTSRKQGLLSFIDSIDMSANGDDVNIKLTYTDNWNKITLDRKAEIIENEKLLSNFDKKTILTSEFPVAVFNKAINMTLLAYIIKEFKPDDIKIHIND